MQRGPIPLRLKGYGKDKNYYYEKDDGTFTAEPLGTGRMRQNVNDEQRMSVPVRETLPSSASIEQQQQQQHRYNNDMLLGNVPNTFSANMDFNIPIPENGVAPQDDDFDLDFPFEFVDLDNDIYQFGNETNDLFGNTVPEPGPARKKRATNVSERNDGTVVDTDTPFWEVFSDDDVPPVKAEAVTDQIQGEKAFLGKILEVFPDVDHDYVKNLYENHKVNLRPGQLVADIIEPVVEEILAGCSYPKQNNRKRKRNPADSESDSEEITRFRNAAGYTMLANKALSREFPLVPLPTIRTLLRDHQTLFAAYKALYRLQSSGENGDRPPYERLRRPRQYRGTPVSDMYMQKWPMIERELEKARKAVAKEEDAKILQKQIEAAEKRNEEEHAKAGALIECQCCFSDAPPNRTIPCEGESTHFFCYTCVKTSAQTQIGLMKYEMRCFDVSGCQAGFNRQMLKLAVGETVMEKLESLQQLDEIAKAGLEGLEDCPFCDFKAVCPPVEEDREFRCLNPDCEKVSCRLCRDQTHVPKSCEEAKKEKGLPERHAVEEAMSEALIRTCPRCKINIIKENGCNKLRCVQCHCDICNVCRKDITREGYDHFTRHGCPLHENDQGVQRQQEEVKRAERVAIERIMANNSHLDREALRVKVPELKKETTRRRPTQQNRRHPAHPLMPVDMDAAPRRYPLPAYPVRFPQLPAGPGLQPYMVDNRAVPLPGPPALGPGVFIDARPYHLNMYGHFGGYAVRPEHLLYPAQPEGFLHPLLAGPLLDYPPPGRQEGRPRRPNNGYQF
ncbi:hypothetical protein VTN77DRAFT_8234 [Rasamsonia byssochlamydoides]|uniref:uncharacterized protein n=1 Tax=Rasamsonia byssochlamydoides TaxID=89139 RepID=UPI003741EAB1